MMRFVAALSRVTITLLMVLAALVGGGWMWVRYEMDPWTRDGRVRADIVKVAPDVSGLVTDVLVHDNETVKRGQVLFVIDQPRYQLALAQADAAIANARAALDEAIREDRRNHGLGTLVSTEVMQQGVAKVEQLRAALALAQANRNLAGLNLERTMVRALVDGIVTNVRLHPGDYLTAGSTAMALVDTESLHVDGYIEESRLPAIRVGDPAQVWLMGVGEPVLGHVESFDAAVADPERRPDPEEVADINQTFSWVRLDVRIPVRIAIDHVPNGLSLISGRTATVVIKPRSAVPVVPRSYFFPW
jgi:multidrug resistance efflux pump